jgi:hypothetical protein
MIPRLTCYPRRTPNWVMGGWCVSLLTASCAAAQGGSVRKAPPVVQKRLVRPTAPSHPAHLVPTPPQLLLASGINENQELVIQTYRSVTRLPGGPNELPTGTSYKSSMPVPLTGVTILTAAGKPVALPDARKRLAREMAVLVTANGEKPSPVYLHALAPDLLVFVFPGKAPAFEPARWPVDKPVANPDGRQP